MTHSMRAERALLHVQYPELNRLLGRHGLRRHLWGDGRRAIDWQEMSSVRNSFPAILTKGSSIQARIFCWSTDVMTISEILSPTITSLGPMKIRRVLPAPGHQMVGPFIYMDQGGPQTLPRSPDSGVPEHPHAGLSTFTYLLNGHGLHRDSAGHSAIIEVGDIALMSAGSGVTHEEVPDPNDESPTLQSYFVQMWLALPNAQEDMTPMFELHKAASLPSVSYQGGRVRLLMGTAWGKTAPTTCYVETIFADIELQKDGILPIECACTERAIFVLEGELQIGGRLVEQHSLALLEPGGQPEISSAAGSRAILFGGATFPSPCFVHGGFVASSKNKLALRQEEYRSGKFPSIRT